MIGTCFVNNSSLWNWLYLRKKHGLSVFSLPSIITDLQTSCFRSHSPRCASCHSVSSKRARSSPLLLLNRVSRQNRERSHQAVLFCTHGWKKGQPSQLWFNMVHQRCDIWFVWQRRWPARPVQWLLSCLVTGLGKHFRSAENVCFHELFEFGVFCILRVFVVDPFQWFYRNAW